MRIKLERRADVEAWQGADSDSELEVRQCYPETGLVEPMDLDEFLRYETQARANVVEF